MTEEYEVYSCEACGEFETVVNVGIIAHQALCEKMEPEKREYRRSVLSLFVDEEKIPQVFELVTKMAKDQADERTRATPS